MTTIPLSPRIRTVFKRFVEVHLQEFIERAKKADVPDGDEETEELCCTTHHVNLKFGFCHAEHEENCPRYEECDYYLEHGKTCDHCDPKPMYLWFHLRRSIPTSGGTLLTKWWNVDTINQELIFEWITSWKEELVLCMCGDVATVGGRMCKVCYVHGYHRTEEEGGICCVCHENDGRWIRFACGHEVHRHCFRDMKKCPLCRATVDYTSSKTDPYDI